MATDAKQAPAYSAAPRAVGDRRAIASALYSLWLPTALLFFGTLIVYWNTRTQANTFDAISYANQIAHLYPRTGNPRWLFHPHHLLFNALGYVLWRFASLCGYVGGPLVVLQSFNTALGSAGIAVFYLTLRRLLQRSRWLPLLVSLGLAFSFGYWICATDGRVNMPSVFLMLCAFAALCRTMQRAHPGLAAIVGVLAGAAVLFHESAGLFVVVGLTGVLLAEDDPLLLPAARRRQRQQMVLAYLGAWAVTVGLPYLVVGVCTLHLYSVASFRHWTSEYAELGWWWDFHIIHNIRLDFYAFRHAAFVEPPGKQGTFHLSRHAPFALSRLYFAALGGWLAAVYGFCAALPLLWRSHNRQLMIVCVVWILVYAAFFTVWSPGYFVFWVPVLVPTAIMLALALAHYRARRGGLAANWLLGGWIVLYAVLNAQASILPHLTQTADPFRRIAADIHAHTRLGDVIVVAGSGDGGPCEVALPYFADREVVSLHTLLTRSRNNKPTALFGERGAQAQISAALTAGHAVYALDEVIPTHNARTQADLATRHHITPTDLKTLFSPYERTLAWQSPRGPVWNLTLLLAKPVAQP